MCEAISATLCMYTQGFIQGGGKLGFPPPKKKKSLRILILLIEKSIVRPNLKKKKNSGGGMPPIPHFVDVQRVPSPKLKILYETMIRIASTINSPPDGIIPEAPSVKSATPSVTAEIPSVIWKFDFLSFRGGGGGG